MNMKRLLSLVAFFATLHASAQQINPVPDYVFRNQMSVGRNAVTDTAAYFSIGPRYGATRGMMPPMVVDTASFSGNKRNGLLIFSVQKNKFLYWDSVGVKWAEMSGTGGSAIAGTGTTNYIPKFTGVSTIGNSRIFDNGTNIGFGVDTPNYRFHFQADRASMKFTSTGSLHPYIDFAENTNTLMGFISAKTNGGIRIGNQSLTVRFIVDSSGFVGLGTNIVPTQQLDVDGKARIRTIDSVSTAINMLSSDANGLIVKSVLPIQGSGTSNKVPKFTATRTIADGIITDNGSNIGINTTPSSWSVLRAVQIKGAGFIGDNTYDAYAAVTSNTYYDGSNWKYMSSIGGAARHDLDFGDHKFYYAAAGTAGNNITFTRGMTLTVNGELLVNTTTDNGDFKLQINGNTLLSGNIRTAAPAGGTANDWRLGTVATVSPTSPNRTIEVSIGGTIYYIAAKTTND